MYRVDASFRHRFISYARLFKESLGRNHDALRFMREMKHRTQLTAELYCHWIDTLAAAGERNTLSTVLQEMRGFGLQVTQEHYKRMLFAMSSLREYNACEALAQEMRKEGITMNTEFLNYFVSHNHSPQLEKVFQMLRSDSIRKQANTIATATQATATATTTPQVTTTTTQEASKATPDSDIAQASVNAQITPENAENAENAQISTEKLEKAAPPTPTFITRLIEKIRHSNMEQTRELLREMRTMYANPALYNSLMSNAPNESIAWLILTEMVAHGVRPSHHTFNTLLCIPSAKGMKGKAEVLLAMKKHGITPDVVTYNSLMKFCVQDLDKNGCIAFFQKMLNKNIKPTVATYNQMLHLAKKLRDRIWFEEVKNDMNMNWIEPNAATEHLLLEPEDTKFWKN